MLTSTTEENTLGNNAWRDFLSKNRISTNNTLNNMLNRVGANIAAVAGRPDFKWEFKVIDSNDANAFCLPGGKVAVYTGLFRYVSNDAELAAVVGHEVGHAIARHGGERMSQETVRQVGAEILATGLQGDANVDAWLLAYSGLSQVGVMLPYSRTHEYEADKIGMVFMAKAGYSPGAAISFWEKFANVGGSGSALTEFISTHPLGGKRLQEMKAMQGEMLDIYSRAPVKRGLGQPFAN